MFSVFKMGPISDPSVYPPGCGDRKTLYFENVVGTGHIIHPIIQGMRQQRLRRMNSIPETQGKFLVPEGNLQPSVFFI